MRVSRHNTIDSCLVCGPTNSRFDRVLRDHVSGDEFQLWVCLDCGLYWVANPPIETEMYRYYETDMGRAMRSREENLFARLRMIRLRREARAISRIGTGPVSVVDFGTGDGAFAVALSREGFLVEARDMYPTSQWKHIEIPYAEVGHGLLNADSMRVAGGVADLIVLRHVLEHSLHPLELLQQFERMGVPHLKIAVPNVGSRLRKACGDSWYFWDPPRHLFHFTVESVSRLASAAGYRVVKIETTGIDEIVSSVHRYLRTRETSGESPSAFRSVLIRATHPTSLLAGISSGMAGLFSKGVINVYLTRT